MNKSQARSVFLTAVFLWSNLGLASARAEAPPAWAIASAHPMATAAGFEIAAAGGNAFDAAVAVSAALAVVEPMGSGLGGGGFWLLHRSEDGLQTMVDGRERAPLAAKSNMFLDANGQPRAGVSLDGALAAAIPGEPAALVYIAEKYGRLPLARVLAPAIRFAEQGFAVTPRYQRLVEFRLKVLDANSVAVFAPTGSVPELGTVIRQPDLAHTLTAIATRGRAGFYAGPVGQKLVDGVRRSGGIWTQKDLQEYQVKERKPVIGEYRGVRIVSAAPPSAGGVVMLQVLNVLESTMNSGAEVDTSTVHNVVEAMRRAFYDRARYLGDPDFGSIDIKTLTSKSYAKSLASGIEGQATPSEALDFDMQEAGRPTGTDTTHFSIIDDRGNRVAATLSNNYYFGSGVMPAGTGVILNNEMDDFTIKPNPDRPGRNMVAPGKRPMSSMTPTFLEHPDRVVVLGTPGGSRIVTMVTLAVLDLIDGGWDLKRAVERPRYHHQFLPDYIAHEPDTFNAELVTGLGEKGHTLQPTSRPYGNMQAVMWDRRQNKMEAASDPRGEGEARVSPVTPAR